MTPTIAVDIRVLGTGRTSGIEEYTERLLERLLPLDDGVRYKLFYAGRRPLVRRPWMELPHVTVHEQRMSNRLLFARTRLTGRPYLDRLVQGADVFFFPHFLLGATSPACRRVLTMHDLSYERFPELFSVTRRLWHRVQMRPRRQVGRANRIIAVSESTRRDLIGRYGNVPDKVVTVHSGVDPRLQRPSDALIDSFRLVNGLPGRFILALGTIEPRKNIRGLIAAFAHIHRSHPDTELVVAGPRGWLWRDIAATRSGRDGIRFVADVPAGERALWLSAASVLAYPSLFEGFGFPPLEAMACGTPALVGANSSMAEVCGNAAVAVNPYSVPQMAAGLEALLDDAPLRRTLIARGITRAAAFSWRTAAEKTRQVIFSTLS